MALRKLDFEGLHILDGGKLSAAFEHELAIASRDCLDRPGDKAPRLVNLQIKLVPVMDSIGSAINVAAEFKVNASVHKRKTRTYELLTQPNGKLLFSEHSPTNPLQRTFDDAAEEDAEDYEAGEAINEQTPAEGD